MYRVFHKLSVRISYFMENRRISDISRIRILSILQRVLWILLENTRIGSF